MSTTDPKAVEAALETWVSTSSHGGMVKCLNGTGPYVAKADYDKLAAEVRRLTDKNAELCSRLDYANAEADRLRKSKSLVEK